MDRTEASRQIARVFAYLACGKTAQAREAAQTLIAWLATI